MQVDDSRLTALIALGGLVLAYVKLFPKVSAWISAHPRLALGICVLAVGATLVILANYLRQRTQASRLRRSIIAAHKTSIYLGVSEEGTPVYLPQESRSSHAQVIGTTSCGKTESVIFPWAIHDIQQGTGLIIIDGKSDQSFLDKLYAYVCASNRQKDFHLFSLAHIDPSSTFNPLANAPALDVAERVFSSFPIDHPFYRAVQSKIFHALLLLIQDKKHVPTFELLHTLLSSSETLVTWLKDYEKVNQSNHLVLQTFVRLPLQDRINQTGGLEANLLHFSTGPTAQLFNSQKPQIDFDEVLKDGKICYFQLPTMYYPFLAEATGKLVLQAFQYAVARRQLGLTEKPKFFACYLDDFQDYLYQGFGSLLNKSRSANVGVVFSHQSLGDLDKIGPHFRNVVSTCTNTKVVMRSNDPMTCDFLAKTFGTDATEKITERQKKAFLFTVKTGDGSSREVEEFKFHPNLLRRLPRGCGVVAIPHTRGVLTLQVAFDKRADLPPRELPSITKT